MPGKAIKRCLLWLVFFNLLFLLPVHAQYFDFSGNRKKVIIPFHQVRDLVIIKLMINDKGPFNFIMDTGVGMMIITDPQLLDSLNLLNRHLIKINGFGEGEGYEAYVSPNLKIDIPGLTSYNVQAAILKKDNFGISNYAGMPIHGLLGYEFFNHLAVKINFGDSTITVYRPKDVKLYAKGEKIPISIEDRKPYLETHACLPNGCIKKVKLVVDLGAGHPLSLENMTNNHDLPEKAILANLGMGFNGPINGYICRIGQIQLGKYKISNPISCFPKNDSVCRHEYVKRDGNMGMGLLKKFIVVFDYADSVIYLKPGKNFDQPFEHDMSGLEYYADGDDYKRIIISQVEPGSAGDKVGLEKDDEILSINMKPIAKMSLEEVDDIFKSQNNRNLLLEVSHDKKLDMVVLTLKRRI